MDADYQKIPAPPRIDIKCDDDVREPHHFSAVVERNHAKLALTGNYKALLNNDPDLKSAVKEHLLNITVPVTGADASVKDIQKVFPDFPNLADNPKIMQTIADAGSTLISTACLDPQDYRSVQFTKQLIPSTNGRPPTMVELGHQLDSDVVAFLHPVSWIDIIINGSPSFP